jgi:hypothetical protein
VPKKLAAGLFDPAAYEGLKHPSSDVLGLWGVAFYFNGNAEYFSGLNAGAVAEC